MSAEAYKVTFTASRRLRDKLAYAQDLLRHQNPSGDLETVVEQGLDRLIEDLEKKRFAADRSPRPGAGARAATQKRKAGSQVEQADSQEQNGGLRERTRGSDERGAPQKGASQEGAPRKGPREKASRHIPAEIRRQVHARDGGRCTFVDGRGVRCGERAFLEYDHVEGFARTGRHEVETLRLRCRAHNQLGAEQLYGKSFMEGKRAKAARARKRAQGRPEAADRSARRAPA